MISDMKMSNRELKRRYIEMKLTYKNIINANTDLADENKILKEENERLNNIIKEVREEIKRYKQILETGAEQNVFYIYLDSLIQKLEKFLEILDKE